MSPDMLEGVEPSEVVGRVAAEHRERVLAPDRALVEVVDTLASDGEGAQARCCGPARTRCPDEHQPRHQARMELQHLLERRRAAGAREVDVGEVARCRHDQVGQPSPGRPPAGRPGRGPRRGASPLPPRVTTPSVVACRSARRAIRAVRPGDRSTSVTNALTGPQLSTSSVAREHVRCRRSSAPGRGPRALTPYRSANGAPCDLAVVGQQDEVVVAAVHPATRAHRVRTCRSTLIELRHRLRVAPVRRGGPPRRSPGSRRTRSGVPRYISPMTRSVSMSRMSVVVVEARRTGKGMPARDPRLDVARAAGGAPGTTRGPRSSRTGPAPRVML